MSTVAAVDVSRYSCGGEGLGTVAQPPSPAATSATAINVHGVLMRRASGDTWLSRDDLESETIGEAHIVALRVLGLQLRIALAELSAELELKQPSASLVVDQQL